MQTCLQMKSCTLRRRGGMLGPVVTPLVAEWCYGLNKLFLSPVTFSFSKRHTNGAKESTGKKIPKLVKILK